jgi:hypothetical protein
VWSHYLGQRRRAALPEREQKKPFFFFSFPRVVLFLFMPVDFVYLFRELSCACEQLSCDAYMVSSVCDEV